MEKCARKSCEKPMGQTRWILATKQGIKALCSPKCYSEESADEQKRAGFLKRLTLNNFNGA